MSEQKVYVLIEHGEGNDPARIHICKTEDERIQKTAIAIYGDVESAGKHPEEFASDISTLTMDRRLDFEGDPSLEWFDGFLSE